MAARRRPCAWALAVLAARSVDGAAQVQVTARPTPIYSTVTSKLRIQGLGFGSGSGDAIGLKFIPHMDPADYKIQVVSDTVLSVGLVPGKSWPITNTVSADGQTLYLTSFTKGGGGNLMEEPVTVATVINTPTVMDGGDKIIYMTGTTRFNINGTAFRAKTMTLTFEPPLVKNEDYMLNVRSPTHMQLTLMSSRKWRSDGDPGPLKLRRIDTGAGALRIDAKYGGVTVAEVQVDLGAHGVTVESAPATTLYQGDPTLKVLGEGFNSTATYNTLKWGNSLRGKGINYTITQSSASQLTLSLKPGSKWRSNPANLPGPLKLLAVNAGGGLVPVGPTEAKKGRTVATIFEDPYIAPNPTKAVYQTHTHELWVTGRGFTRNAYSTKLEFDPPLQFGVDYVMMVFNRTHMLVSLMDGRKWAPTTGILRVTSIDTGAGPFKGFPPTVVAHVASDADDHPSGLSVTRTASQILYQTAAIRKLVVTGSGFCAAPKLTFKPDLAAGVDYDVSRSTPEKLVLSLRKHKKWRYEAGPLYLQKIQCGSDAPVELAYGQGIVVATVLADPTVEMSERKIYATHTKRLIVQGSGFSLDGTELTLRPTSRASYEVESVEMAEMVLLLKEGKSWTPTKAKDDGKPVAIYVTKVDTGAGEVVMEDDGMMVAKVFPDPSGAVCDDSCEWALDGVCDDGSAGEKREAFDDDYGGFYGYDDDYYGGYGYYYYDDDDDFLAPVCEPGTDCTDCGGADPDAAPIECTNTCQWANDNYCDDTRTSGLCDLGTDCHDCGPASKGNFTTWDDDGWWDDDENYWDDDYDWENYESVDDEPHVAFIKSTPNPKSRKGDLDEAKGVGGIFMMLLEGIVVGVGALMCAIGSWFAHKFYKGEKLPFELLAPPSAEDELEMARASAKVPITPDVAYTGGK